MKKGKALKLARRRRQYQEAAPERNRQLQERIQRATQERAARAEQLARERAARPLEGEILPPKPDQPRKATVREMVLDRIEDSLAQKGFADFGRHIRPSLSLAMALEEMFIAEDNPLDAGSR